jgi:hypothetical protein
LGARDGVVAVQEIGFLCIFVSHYSGSAKGEGMVVSWFWH